MLKITACPSYYTPKERKKLIRYGYDSAIILYAFDDDTVGGCRVFPTKVIYLYSEDGKNFTQFDRPPQEIIQKLGLIDNGDKFIVNIIDMDQPLLLVDSNVRENYELMKLLTENVDLSEIREKVKFNISDFEKLESDLNFTKFDLEKALEGHEYKNLDNMEFAVDYAEKELQQLYLLEEIVNLLNGVKSNWITPKPFNRLALQLEISENCEMICTSLKRMHLEKKKDFVLLDKEFEILNSVHGILGFLKSIRVVSANGIVRSEKTLDLLEKVSAANEVLLGVKILKEQRLKHCEMELEVMSSVKSVLNSLGSISICKVDYTRCFSILQIIDCVGNVVTVLERIKQTRRDQINSQKRVSEIQAELEGRGETFQCSRFGKVIYNGGECVHLD